MAAHDEEAAEGTLHGSAVALDGAAVLLRGPSGAGKSDLAFRLVSERGARLVADDRVRLRPPQGPDPRPRAAAPAALVGRIELRGLGIVRLHESELLAEAPVALVVDLVARAAVPRLPSADPVLLAGVATPRLRLHAFDASAPAKIDRALRLVAERAGGAADGIGPPAPAPAPETAR